ncbi:MAG: putative quinol monooxygenase [Planctomycetia bacterium]
MVNEYVRYRIPPDSQAAFVSDYERAGEFLRASPVCLGYDMSRCEEDGECYILRIMWTSTADHLNVFRKSEQFRGFLPLVRPYIGHKEEMRHYEPTPLVWQRPASSIDAEPGAAADGGA